MISIKNQLPEGDQDAIISALVMLILDKLEHTSNTPDPHYQYLRAIFQRYPLQVVIAEMRNILNSLYFPKEADLSQLVMQYHNITLVPQQRPDGYSTTFIYNQALHSTPVTSQPLKSLEFAQHMVDQLRAGIQEAVTASEERRENGTLQAAKAPENLVVPAASIAQTPLPFVRVGRIALAIDRILYVEDDSTARYQSVRVGLAGGVDMRIGNDSSNNYMHTQEIKFIGEEAQAFLAWHQCWTLHLSAPSDPAMQEKKLEDEHFPSRR